MVQNLIKNPLQLEKPEYSEVIRSSIIDKPL
jgi:hypothetical protein